MVLGFFTGTTYARNVQLMLPIAAALEAKDIPDRPTGLVKFFFGNQASPQFLTKLESYVAHAQHERNGKIRPAGVP